jgi:drug/metabolite transporter (DMT)-like permease
MYIRLVLTTFFWGGTFVAARLAVKETAPFYAASSRFAVATAILLALVAWQSLKERKPFPRPANLAETAILASLGLSGIFCYNAFFFTGLQYTGAANGSLIVAINPILTSVLSAMWLKEHIRPLQILGLLISLCGVCVIVTRGNLEIISSLSFNHGDLLMLGAPLSWAIYSILGKRAMSLFSPLVATTYAALFGTLFLLPVAFWEQSRAIAPYSFSLTGWLAILQLALLGTVIGFVWWYQAIQRIGASRAAIFVNLVPFFGALLAALLLGERLGWPQLWGGAMVICGVFCGTCLSTLKKN